MDENVLVDLYLLGPDVGPLWSQGLEATSVSIRCFGRDWKRREPARGKGIAWKGRRDVDENVLVDLYLFGSDVGPLWFRGLEGTSVSIGCFGRDWNRREPERKALLEELLLV